MRIVIDSSVIVEGDWNLEHNAAQALLAACERGAIELYVPRVVLNEIRNAFEEREISRLKTLNNARAELRAMRGPRAQDGEFEGEVTPRAGYVGYLRETILRVGGQILEYPEIGHQELLERSLRRRAPFDAAGQRGYRDALIWHNVIEVARSGQPVVFATNDGDFRDGKGSDELHPHLVEDLKERSIAIDRVTLASSLSEVIERVVEPAVHMREALSAELTAKEKVRRELQEAMIRAAHRDMNLLDASRVEVKVERGLQAFAAETISENFDKIDRFRRFAISDVIPLCNDRFGVEAWLDATACFDVDVATDGFPPGVSIPSDIDVSADRLRASLKGSAEVRLVFEISYDQRDERLGEPHLVEVRSARAEHDANAGARPLPPQKSQIEWLEIAKASDEGEKA
jgi:hypothetical protein